MGHPFGINLVGLMKSQAGVGEVGRRLYEILKATDIPFSCLNLDTDLSLMEYSIPLSKEYPYHITIIATEPVDSPKIERLYPGIFKDRYVIGIWNWELDKYLRPLPPKDILSLYHEIWTISEFSRKAIQEVVQLPVKVARIPMTPVTGSYDLPKKFTVLFMFSYFSGIARKNPHLAIEAFIKAFGDSDDVQLVLKTTGGDKMPSYSKAIKEKVGDRKNITIIDGDLSDEQRWGLIANSDVCISLHAAGGLEFFPLEGMSLGKAVIATGYSGNMDYMNDENSIIVPYEMVEIPSYCHVYGKYKHKWSYPSTDVAAMYLKALRDDEYRRDLGEKARAYVDREWSVERCVGILKDLVSAIPSTIPRSCTWKVLQDRLGRYDDITSSVVVENGYAHIRDPPSTTVVHHSDLTVPLVLPKGFSFSFKI